MIENARNFGRPILAGLVCLCVAAQCIVTGQSGAGLRIQIIQGNDAQNILEQIPANPIAIRVINQNSQPIQGANVVFTAPEKGPSGDFATGLNSFQTLTDEQGIARATEYRPNDISGTYQIRVQVDYLGEITAALIRQTNVGPKRSLGKVIVILAAAGAAGVAGTALAGRSSNKNSGTPTSPAATIPTITFGGSSVTGKN